MNTVGPRTNRTMIRATGRWIAHAALLLVIWVVFSMAGLGSLEAAGQADTSVSPADGGPVPADVTLHVGDTAILDGGGLQIRLQQVAEDSRCPKDVMCVWMGRARVELHVTVDGADKGVVTATLYPNPRNQPAPELDATVERYVISLTDLQPYPQAGQPRPLDQRVATIHVRASTP